MEEAGNNVILILGDLSRLDYYIIHREMYYDRLETG